MVLIDEIRSMLFNNVEDIANEFKFKQRKAGRFGGMIKITQPVTFCLGWSISDYIETKVFLGFSGFVCHNEVREITLPILRKYRFMGPGASLKDWVPTFHPPEGIPSTSMNELNFKTLSEIEFLKDVYRDFIVNKAFPHFEKWNSLPKVYNYIIGIDDDTKTGLGQTPQYEKAVIMRLCNDNNYKDYFYEYYKSKEKYHLNDPLNADCLLYLNAAKEMLNLLDDIKPIYNL